MFKVIKMMQNCKHEKELSVLISLITNGNELQQNDRTPLICIFSQH